MFRELRACLGLLFLFTLVTGFAYPFLVLKIGAGFFPAQAEGSLIVDNNKVIGSSLIGQTFTRDGYFHARPSAAGTGYDAGQSSGSNLAAGAPDLLKNVKTQVADLKKNANPQSVPIDLVTASGSGLDPHISPAAAQYQMARVAVARQLTPAQIEALIKQYTDPPTLGFLGGARVNVLALNRALDQLPPTP